MPQPLKIAYLTSGAAGMYCGSCLNDNALARALIALGHDVQLIPLYTPIRTDEQDVSTPQIFFGGINVYLQQNVPLFRYLPRWLDRMLDQPWLVRWAAGRGIKTDYKSLGPLAVSMLRGSQGFQRKEVSRLAEWLAGSASPDLLIFSNALTAGCLPELKRRLPGVCAIVTLQGDDIFLRQLSEPSQSQAVAEIRKLAEQVDGFVAHSRFYADAMAAYLGIDRRKIHVLPLGVEAADFELTGEAGVEPEDSRRPPTVGYLARLAPEKGLHVLAEGFIQLRAMPGMENALLRIAGWLGERDRAYAEGVFSRLREAGLADAFEYVGEVDRPGKVRFLKSIDVLAVPTVYQEPKGLFVLEALATGVPVVMPDHGSFPETLADLGGGLLHQPEDPQQLGERLQELLSNPQRRRELGQAGQTSIRLRRAMRPIAERAMELYRQLLPPGGREGR